MNQRIELRTHEPIPPRAYRVAGLDLVTNARIPALRVYETGDPAGWSTAAAMPEPEADGRIIYDGPGWIDNRWRRVTSRYTAAGYWLSIDEDVTYHIRADGGLVTESGAASSSIALGAPLMLALALRGVFCLHAGVVAFEDELVAFVGESGAGKSTLARYLDGVGSLWRRVIDDTLPLAIDERERLVAYPHLPQPKIDDVGQPAVLVPERMPLRVVYLLDAAAETPDAVATAPVDRLEAAIALVGHTVGGRLFAPDLMAAHLSFCAAMAQCVPVRRLSYPRRLERLPDVAQLLSAELEQVIEENE